MVKSEFLVLIKHYFLRGKSKKLKKSSQNIITVYYNTVLNDRRLKVREISETVNISVGRVWHI